MMFRNRRVAAMLTAAALVTSAGVALGSSPSGASSPRASAALPSTVGIDGLCGGIVTGNLPTNLRAGEDESNTLHVYREKADYTVATTSIPVDFTRVGTYKLASALPSTQPTIAIGTHVNSYLIHSDVPGTAIVRRAATIGFTTNIIGVEILSSTLSEGQTVQLRGAATYANNISGLDLGTLGHGDYAQLIDSRTLAFSFKTSAAVDEIRVITSATTSATTALAGYRTLAADGGVFDFGGQKFYGSTGATVLNKPVVAGQNTCGNAGYWFVASDGGVFSYGDARFYGSAGATPLSSPVVGMAVTATGAGYYLVTATGQVLPYGDADVFNNSAGKHDLTYLHLNKPIVGMVSSPSGHGYWLVASDGGIFSFGDAGFFGSTGNLHLVSPVVGMAATKSGHGYYMYAADGGIFAFGDAHFFGSVGGTARANPVVGMRLTASGLGYFFDDSAGTVYHFGDAVFAGDMTGVKLSKPMIGMM